MTQVTSRMPSDAPRRERSHILSVALEDYFHGPAFKKLIAQRQWARFEARLEKNCATVLDLLAGAASSATFFIHPWTAQSRPDICRELVRHGHEIALAGPRTASFRFTTPEELRKYLREGRAIVEAACGRKVLGYRVTDVRLSEADLWALDVLCEEGFAYDSSLSPCFGYFAGQPWRHFVHKNTVKDSVIWEVPLSSYKAGPLLFPVAGGNYFRQYPESLVRYMLSRTERRSDLPLVLYFRLWDFDPEQPRIESGSRLTKVRHYRNSQRIVSTLRDLFKTYRFTNISRYLDLQQTELTPSPVPAGAAEEKQTAAVVRPVKTPISIIVPCYNEAASVVYLANNLQALKVSLQDEYDVAFILVDDGSKDETWSLLNTVFAGRTDTLLLRHEQNTGVAGAIATGLAHAREIACSMDCDCSYDPLLLRPMLQLLTEGVDLVTVSPYHPAGGVLHVPQWRLFLSKGASALYQRATGLKLHTFTACLRVYRRESIVPIRLKHKGFLGVAELIGHLAQQGKTVVEHPGVLESRIFGRSKMKVLRTTLGHFRLLGSIAWLRLRQTPPAVPKGTETAAGVTAANSTARTVQIRES